MATKPGKFDPDKLEKLNLSALFDQHEPNWMDSEDHLMALRQWHRQLSEEMVATYRELARLAVRNGGTAPRRRHCANRSRSCKPSVPKQKQT